MKPSLKTRYKTFLLPQGISHAFSIKKKEMECLKNLCHPYVSCVIIFSVSGQFYFILSKWVLPNAFLIASPIPLDPAEIIEKKKRTIHPEILLSRFKISKVLVSMTLQTV